jgi:hypothetical protein
MHTISYQPPSPSLGIYPGVFSPLSVGGLQLNETTMATALQTVGYATGGLGKCRPERGIMAVADKQDGV